VYDTSTTLNGISATYGGKTYYGMCRSFFYFDTTGASSPSAVDLLVYGATNARSDAEAQKGTQADSLSAADYDAFSGTEYGHVSWAIGSYNTISFDSTGVNEIVTDGISKICCREYTHDYGDSQPSSGYQNGCYYADETGTDKDPYLEITEGAAVGIPYYYYAQEQAAALCG